MRKTLWTRNFTLVTAATAIGAFGGIACEFALSFLVFDETRSTLAAALVLAIEVIPGFFIPLVAAPWMDRLPRKPFLVAGDAANALLYGIAGWYLLRFEFSYIGYLVFSLILSSLGTFDRLAYNSIYPKLIPAGMEEKGYSVSAMLYPLITVIMMPIAAILYEKWGVAMLLLMQAALSALAAVTESFIRIEEHKRMDGQRFSLRLWRSDLRDAARYIKREKGVMSIFTYIAATQGCGSGYGPIMVAFFRTTPGLSIAMYALYSVAEVAGRTLGGLLNYCTKISPKKRYGFVFSVYLAYQSMDMCLLWLPYPLMMINRGIAGFLGINSATMRQAAVQRYIPEEMRARINGFFDMLTMGAIAVCSVAVGALGDVLDYRWCLTVCGGFCIAVCLLTIWKNRRAVRAVYETEAGEGAGKPASAAE